MTDKPKPGAETLFRTRPELFDFGDAERDEARDSAAMDERVAAIVKRAKANRT